MNTKLVESLAQAVLALSSEERNLFQRYLEQTAPTELTDTQRLEAFQTKLREQHGGNLPKILVEDIIYQMREERDEQVISACFPQSPSETDLS